MTITKTMTTTKRMKPATNPGARKSTASEAPSFEPRTYTKADLRKRYEAVTGHLSATIRLTRGVVGGVPAEGKALQAFIRHHLKLEGKKAEDAMNRILKEELDHPEGTDITPPEGEIQEAQVYSVSMLRNAGPGPYLGDWMVKACMKAAASRIGLFKTKRGTKGDVSEMGEVLASEASLIKGLPPYMIHLVDDDGVPVQTEYTIIRGRVSTPQGAKSILGHHETAPIGSLLHFEMRWFGGKLTADDWANIFTAAGHIGLGSAKSYQRGQFEIERLEVDKVR